MTCTMETDKTLPGHSTTADDDNGRRRRRTIWSIIVSGFVGLSSLHSGVAYCPHIIEIDRQTDRDR